jgi:hypothetical protein
VRGQLPDLRPTVGDPGWTEIRLPVGGVGFWAVQLHQVTKSKAGSVSLPRSSLRLRTSRPHSSEQFDNQPLGHPHSSVYASGFAPREVAGAAAGGDNHPPFGLYCQSRDRCGEGQAPGAPLSAPHPGLGVTTAPCRLAPRGL